jgi:hypothetical protein
LVAVFPKIRADEGRADGGEGPEILGFDFEEEEFHRGLGSIDIRRSGKGWACEEKSIGYRVKMGLFSCKIGLG